MSINSIKNWAEEDRPREKMLIKGREALSNSELIAILLGSGSRSESAVSLAKRILSEAGNIDDLGRKPLEFLTSFKGIGEAKAVTVAAALELGRRRQIVQIVKKPKISSSREAFELIGPILSDLSHEEFWMVSLNRANIVISKDKISSGGVSGTVVDPKIIFSHAIRRGASSVLFYHNHPSGQLNPSQADITLTRKLIAAGQVLDIKVQDHIIIGRDNYYSFLDEGQM